jgi:YggT family protein
VGDHYRAAIISWVNPDPYNSIVRSLHRVTAPVLKSGAPLIGGRLGPIEISPLIVIFRNLFSPEISGSFADRIRIPY